LDEYCDRLLGYLPIASIRGAIMLMFFNMFFQSLAKSDPLNGRMRISDKIRSSGIGS
jgi:hypothetical protein